MKHNTHFCNIQVYVSRPVHFQSGCEAWTIKATIADSYIYLEILGNVSSKWIVTKNFQVGIKSLAFTEEQNNIGESILH
jgi:hypothetical protein